jgi:hypothetical protein
MVYNHRPTPTHQQQTYQQPTHLQYNFALYVIVNLNTAKEFEFWLLPKEFNLFESSEVRTPNLDMLISALRTIQPTSTDRQRVRCSNASYKSNQEKGIHCNSFIRLIKSLRHLLETRFIKNRFIKTWKIDGRLLGFTNNFLNNRTIRVAISYTMSSHKT